MENLELAENLTKLENELLELKLRTGVVEEAIRTIRCTNNSTNIRSWIFDFFVIKAYDGFKASYGYELIRNVKDCSGSNAQLILDNILKEELKQGRMMKLKTYWAATPEGLIYYKRMKDGISG